MLYNGLELSASARYNPFMHRFWLPGAGTGLCLPPLLFGEDGKQPVMMNGNYPGVQGVYLLYHLNKMGGGGCEAAKPSAHPHPPLFFEKIIFHSCFVEGGMPC